MGVVYLGDQFYLRVMIPSVSLVVKQWQYFLPYDIEFLVIKMPSVVVYSVIGLCSVRQFRNLWLSVATWRHWNISLHVRGGLKCCCYWRLLGKGFLLCPCVNVLLIIPTHSTEIAALASTVVFTRLLVLLSRRCAFVVGGQRETGTKLTCEEVLTKGSPHPAKTSVLWCPQLQCVRELEPSQKAVEFPGGGCIAKDRHSFSWSRRERETRTTLSHTLGSLRPACSKPLFHVPQITNRRQGSIPGCGHVIDPK